MRASKIIPRRIRLIISVIFITLIDIYHDEVHTSRGDRQVHVGLYVTVLGVTRVYVDDRRNGGDDPFVRLATVKIRPSPFHFVRPIFGAWRAIKLHVHGIVYEFTDAVSLSELEIVHNFAVVQICTGRVRQPSEIPVVAFVILTCVQIVAASTQVNNFGKEILLFTFNFKDFDEL